MPTNLRVAVPCGNILGESPTWSVREQSLYWVDIRGRSLHCFVHASRSHRRWPLTALCPAVILASHGLLIATEHSLLKFDTQSGRAGHFLDVEPPIPGNRLNEAKADRKGRLWIGSMRDFGAAVSGSLYRITHELQVSRVLGDLCVPNSLCWSPDNRTMYFADSADGGLRAYEYDVERASLGEVRVVLPAEALPGRPDGCTVDAQGCLWNARYGAGSVARIAPDGSVITVVDLPISRPTSCALGGADLRTLYITTAAQGLSDDECRSQPFAGHLFAAEVEVPGIPDADVRLD